MEDDSQVVKAAGPHRISSVRESRHFHTVLSVIKFVNGLCNVKDNKNTGFMILKEYLQDFTIDKCLQDVPL